MKSRQHEPVGLPIRLHLEYQRMTAAELSAILRQWQVVLRAVWVEAYLGLGPYPNKGVPFTRVPRSAAPRILVSALSDRESIDVWVEYAVRIGEQLAVPALFAGPVKDWPSVVRGVYAYLVSLLHSPAMNDRDLARDYVSMETSHIKLVAPADVLWDGEAAKSLGMLMDRAMSGDLRTSISLEEQMAVLAKPIPGGETENLWVAASRESPKLRQEGSASRRLVERLTTRLGHRENTIRRYRARYGDIDG